MSQTFVIIDGHYYAYRFFFGMPRLTGPDKRQTGVTFSFAKLFRQLRDNADVSHALLVFDHRDPTFRHNIYPEYKAQRDPMPDDLRSQMPDVEKLAEESNIPMLSISGYEADDVIATLARTACDQGFDVRICSRDKDLDQILDANIHLWDPSKDEYYGIDDLQEKRGVRPDQIIDYLCMMGDSADNVPGIKGVGPKTAMKLLNKYDSLENIFASIDELKGKQKENIAAFADKYPLTKELITIVDVPDLPEPDSFTLSESLPDEAKPFYESLGFSTGTFFPRKVKEASHGAEYTLVTPNLLNDFAELLSQQKRFAFDTETTGLDPLQIELVGISICFGSKTSKRAWYLPFMGTKCDTLLSLDDVREKLGPIFANAKIGKCAQNAKYDYRVLQHQGFEIHGIDGDSMLASWLLDPARSSHGLDYLTEHFLEERKIPTTDVIDLKSGETMDLVPVETVCTYACEDAQCTWRLCQILEAELKKEGLLEAYRKQEVPLLTILGDIEQRGIHVDRQTLQDKQEHLESYLDEVLNEIRRHAGQQFNPASPKHVAKYLFEDLGLPVIRKTKTGPSTDARVLEALRFQHPMPDLLLQFRSLSKLLGTYLRTLPDFINPNTHAIHSSLNQNGTETGRLSSSEPNLQNIPKKTDLGREIRNAFVPRDNYIFLAADYSQIELRVLAHFSADETLQEAFSHNRDIHRFVAAEVNGVEEDEVTPQMRQAAKAINFGIIYGQSAFGLSQQLGISRPEAQRFIDDYFNRFSNVRTYIDTLIEEAKDKGYVESISGRRRYIPTLRSSNKNEQAQGNRTALNSTIQGSAADLIKRAMIRCEKMLPNEAQLILQIHDELIVETPIALQDEASSSLQEAMVNAWELSVPLVAEVQNGESWFAVS